MNWTACQALALQPDCTDVLSILAGHISFVDTHANTYA
jgi:hypothetical protein